VRGHPFARFTAGALLVGGLLAACGGGAASPAATAVAGPSHTTTPTVARRAAAVPRPDHLVVVIYENKARAQIIGSSSAPYLTGLARQGADFTRSYALTHPSQPNYLALFSGSTHGVTSDACPQRFGADNLGHQLLSRGIGFAGYSESMPRDGFTGCAGSGGLYARKHNPWVDFTNVPASANLTYGRFPSDFTRLPAVSFVIPNMCDDMHDCSVATGDSWSRRHLDAYARWAKTHRSLLLVTFDEDNGSAGNQIATFVVGQRVRRGSYSEHVDHDRVLRTIEEMYRLPALGAAASRTPITDIWTS
jgi:phosphatidylinositol-3-phosphatase